MTVSPTSTARQGRCHPDPPLRAWHWRGIPARPAMHAMGSAASRQCHPHLPLPVETPTKRESWPGAGRPGLGGERGAGGGGQADSLAPMTLGATRRRSSGRRRRSCRWRWARSGQPATWWRLARRRCWPGRRPPVSHGLQLQFLWVVPTAAVS